MERPKRRRSKLDAMGTDDAGKANPQMIARGPVAAIVAVKQFGTNGGGYFGMNSAIRLKILIAGPICSPAWESF